ncbi:MAG: NAD(P)-dependent alcohol dehydrogenase [Oscillospiraceae bacterium]|nr:NAD(P)-dependent alcohol dehydrogenase [Oscillospiraceae bacterium]
MINNAVFMTGIKKLETREVPMPSPKEKEVLVKLEYVGICGSDVHYLENGRIGDFVVNGDFILGHECGGTIVEVGAGVKSLKVGDKVALEPGQTCGQCVYCKTGRYNLCPDVEFLATPPYHGCFENYIAYPENMAFKLPENISAKEGALVEPLAVGIHSARQGGVTLGSSVVILGAGCIGLMTLLACKAFGAVDVTVVDIVPKRLECALKLGASRVINALEHDVVEEITRLTNGAGMDIVFETAGTVKTVQQTAYLVNAGGTVVLVGMAPQDSIEYNFAKILGKEAQIKSVFRYRNIYPEAIGAIANGFIDVSGIVSHEFDFSEVDNAFDFVMNNKNDVVKAVIRI